MARVIMSLLMLTLSNQVFAANKSNKGSVSSRHRSKTVSENGNNESSFAKIDAWGEIGQDSFSSSNSGDSSLTLQGIGFGGGAHYRLKAGQSGVGLLGGGIHYTSISAAISGISVAYTLMTLRPDFAFIYYPAKKFGIGAFFAMDIMLLSGSSTVKYEDTSMSTSISSVSQTIFGPRFLFEVMPDLFLGAHYGIGSGSVKTGEATSSFKSNAFNLLLVKNFGTK